MKKSIHKLALAIFIAGAFFSCKNDLEEVNDFTIHENLPLESSTNVEILYSDSAIIKVKLQAPRLDRYIGQKTYLEFVNGVKLTMYNEDGVADSQIEADYAINFEDDNRMEAMNNVIVVNRFGEKLNTEHLIWEAATQRIYTDEFVKITTKEEILYGDGLEANEDFTKYRILNPTGVVSLNDDFE